MNRKENARRGLEISSKMRLRDFLKGKLTEEEMPKLKAAYDIVGSIAIIEIDPELEKKERTIAEAVMELNKHVKTVLKKAGIHSGEFRTQKMKVIAGKRTKETVHKENAVSIKLNVEKAYFSARLSTERKRIAELVKPGEEVLVMFSGCAPYACVIAKNTKAKSIVGIEINPAAHKYGLENLRLNKINNAELIEGDVRKILPRLDRRFDRILMPLPRSAETFLDVAISSAKKNAVIHFYDFLSEEQIPDASVDKIKKACKAAGKKPKILHWNKCGQYSPRSYRACVDFSIS